MFRYIPFRLYLSFQFPRELERICKVLRNLDLSNNRLPELPPAISLYSMLKSLNCDDNKIGQFLPILYPRGGWDARARVVPCGNVVWSTVNSRNCLCSIDNITEQVSDELYKLKRLETLNLGNNRVLSIPPTIGALTALRTINLSGTIISYDFRSSSFLWSLFMIFSHDLRFWSSVMSFSFRYNLCSWSSVMTFDPREQDRHVSFMILRHDPRLWP